MRNVACAAIAASALMFGCGGDDSDKPVDLATNGHDISANPQDLSVSPPADLEQPAMDDLGVGSGPAAAVLCASSGKNAYQTYMAAGFVAVNENIFTNVNAEYAANGTANLGNSFMKIGSGMPASTADPAATFKGKLGAHLIWVYGGPTETKYTDGITYDGKDIDLTVAHTGLAITQDQFNYFVTGIIVPALTKAGVPMSDVSSCFAPPLTSGTLAGLIVGK